MCLVFVKKLAKGTIQQYKSEIIISCENMLKQYKNKDTF